MVSPGTHRSLETSRVQSNLFFTPANFGALPELWLQAKLTVELHFFLSEPVAFRRVYGLQSHSRTSGESNPHRQSVSDTRVPRYQLHHEDDSNSLLSSSPSMIKWFGFCFCVVCLVVAFVCFAFVCFAFVWFF